MVKEYTFEQRKKLYQRGKLWEISLKDDKDIVIYAGTKTECDKWLREKREMGQWRKGKSEYTIGKLIWCPDYE